MIEIKQTCDVCKKSRTVELSKHGSTRELVQAARSDGWREVRENAHLCKNCINDLVK